MSDDIRVGDRFLVEMTVIDTPNCCGRHGPTVDVKVHGAKDSSYPVGLHVLRAAKRLPRQITVGDQVLHRYPNGSVARGSVLGIHDEYRMAWVKFGSGFGSYDLDDLTLVDEASS